MITTCYHGAWDPAVGYRAIAHNRDTGERFDVPHIRRLTTSGRSWGNAGPAAGDLARSILLDALGPAAACPICNGSRYVAWLGDDLDEPPVPFDRDDPADPELVSRCVCDDGYREVPYKQFRDEQVARWADHWSLTRGEVLRWLVRSYGEEVPGWLLEAIGCNTVELPAVEP